MKKFSLSRLLIPVLILTMITASLVSGTYAKYTTTVTATDSVTVARWQADFQKGGTSAEESYTATFDLLGTIKDSGVAGNLLAPGTEGKFDLIYVTEGSQVARNVKITLDVDNVLSGFGQGQLRFYKNPERTFGYYLGSDNILTLEDKDYGPKEVGNATVTVYWKWAFDGDDYADTEDGVAAASFDVTATFTAMQLNEWPRFHY